MYHIIFFSFLCVFASLRAIYFPNYNIVAAPPFDFHRLYFWRLSAKFVYGRGPIFTL